MYGIIVVIIAGIAVFVGSAILAFKFLIEEELDLRLFNWIKLIALIPIAMSIYMKVLT